MILNRIPISCLLIFAALISSSAQAHLMASQNGTLNWVDNGIFMVLSLPVSAFEGIDDNRDGKISKVEFNKYRATFITSIQQQVILSDRQNKHPLEGILLSPVVGHGLPKDAISQLIVMGRFKLVDPCDMLHLRIGLYGKEAIEQSLKMTAMRPSHDQKHEFNLTPKTPTAAIFP